MKTSQKDLVYNLILEKGQVSSNKLRKFGQDNCIASPDRRARELVAEGRLGRRWITDEEKQRYNYSADVMIYYILPAEMKPLIGQYLFTDRSAKTSG